MRTYTGTRDMPLNGPLYNIYPPPDTSWQQDDDRRAQDLIDGRLTNSCVAEVYSRPWDKNHHLAPGGEDFTDAIWGINEGKRDVRQLSTLPERKYGTRKQK